jgi:hypothetical protein
MRRRGVWESRILAGALPFLLRQVIATSRKASSHLRGLGLARLSIRTALSTVRNLLNGRNNCGHVLNVSASEHLSVFGSLFLLFDQLSVWRLCLSEVGSKAGRIAINWVEIFGFNKIVLSRLRGLFSLLFHERVSQLLFAHADDMARILLCKRLWGIW